MPRFSFKKAVSFRVYPVSFLTIITYISLLSALLWVHLVPPSVAPASELDSWGVNLDEAWQDLRVLTEKFRPYNSRRNDEVRTYMLGRIVDILKKNYAEGYDGKVEVVDDDETNVIFAGESSAGLTVYFEGTNIMVYIHGTDATLSPVLLNAHYDSVSTGYGATDDGMAVVSVLQVIQAFTHPSRKSDARIKRGILALLNNGEEDYLNGARAFSAHQMGNLSHTFLNLEGAGAGGRATLFRSTDAEVTKWYQHSNRPFGTVVSGDGFKRNMVKSQTDYKVFVELGMRGLDVAFWEPRSRYHTIDDDVKHTTKESLWHMLGTSLQTLQAATSDTGSEFDQEGDNPAGIGHDGVWFDLFGRAFAVLRLHTLFALTITLIVVPFVIMAITIYTLHISNKLYYFSNTPEQNYTCGGANETRTTRGLRGLTRLPVAIVIASGAVVGAAFLINKVNPMIAYTSQYSVWAMFLSLWWSLAWFVLRGASAVRPTALARGYAFLGQWALWWVILIGVAVSIDRLDLASGYWVLVSYTGVFLSAWISLLELFGLPKKPTPESLNSRWDEAAAAVGQSGGGEISEDEITEATPLFAGSITTFGGYSSIQESQHSDAGRENDVPCDGEFSEQAWSKDMPTWVWIPQFFLSVPFPLILTASIGLLLSTATNQTGADGSSTLTFYLILAVFSIAILLPGTPFYHRISHHVTTTIFFIFIGTLIYNLSAFPFSDHYKLKVYFQQSVNLDSSAATTYLVGHPAYTANIVRDFIPSAWNQNITVHPDPLRVGLSRVEWSSAPLPLVAPGPIREWVSFNVTKYDERHAMVVIEAKETRACKIQFDNAVSGVVVGQSGVPLGKPVAKGGAKEVRLWRREWEGAWEVDVKWDSEVGAGSRLAGRVVCLWSDANDAGNAVPALREVQRFLPRWAVASKLADGLVEGWRAFEV